MGSFMAAGSSTLNIHSSPTLERPNVDNTKRESAFLAVSATLCTPSRSNATSKKTSSGGCTTSFPRIKRIVENEKSRKILDKIDLSTMKIDIETVEMVEMEEGGKGGEIRGRLNKVDTENIDQVDGPIGEMKGKGPIIIGGKEESIEDTGGIIETSEKGEVDGGEVAVIVEKNIERDEKEVKEKREIVVRQQEIHSQMDTIEEENRRYDKLLLLKMMQKRRDREWYACRVKKEGL